MKKIIALIIVVFAPHVFAEDSMSFETVKGPVKQVTVTIGMENNNASLFYGDQPGGCMKIISWYDSIGRLTEQANYIGNQLQDGFVRQYTINNVYMEYNYDTQGLIKGSFAQVQLDSTGLLISTKRYKDGKLICADSAIYDTQGNKIAFYETPFKKDTLALRYTYEYDSIGRLYKESDCQDGIYYTIEYLSNGNYIEHHVNKDGTTWEWKHMVDKNGILVKSESHNMRLRYSKFDKYGNWLQLKSSTNTHSPIGWVTSNIERIIDYYK